MLGLKEYINAHTGSKPIYNQLTWVSSIIDPANPLRTTCMIPNQKDDRVKFILISQLAVSLDGLGSTIDFTNNATPGIIFTVLNFQSSFTINNFYYLLENTDFKIIANNNTIKWSLAYQTISLETKK